MISFVLFLASTLAKPRSSECAHFLCITCFRDQLLQFTSTMDCAPVPREDVPAKHRSTGSYVRVLFETLEKMLKTSGDELYIVCTLLSSLPHPQPVYSSSGLEINYLFQITSRLTCLVCLLSSMLSSVRTGQHSVS